MVCICSAGSWKTPSTSRQKGDRPGGKGRPEGGSAALKWHPSLAVSRIGQYARKGNASGKVMLTLLQDATGSQRGCRGVAEGSQRGQEGYNGVAEGPQRGHNGVAEGS